MKVRRGGGWGGRHRAAAGDNTTQASPTEDATHSLGGETDFPPYLSPPTRCSRSLLESGVESSTVATPQCPLAHDTNASDSVRAAGYPASSRRQGRTHLLPPGRSFPRRSSVLSRPAEALRRHSSKKWGGLPSGWPKTRRTESGPPRSGKAPFATETGIAWARPSKPSPSTVTSRMDLGWQQEEALLVRPRRVTVACREVIGGSRLSWRRAPACANPPASLSIVGGGAEPHGGRRMGLMGNTGRETRWTLDGTADEDEVSAGEGKV